MVKKVYQVMDLLKAGLSDQVLTNAFRNRLLVHDNLFHYQILLKYWFEDQFCQQVLKSDFDHTYKSGKIKISESALTMNQKFYVEGEK